MTTDTTSATLLCAVVLLLAAATTTTLAAPADADAGVDPVPTDRYLSHDEMTRWLQAMERRYPQLIRLSSIGKSVAGRDLWVVEMSGAVGRGRRDLLVPMVKLVGNIHGNEVVGREMILQLIQYLAVEEGRDERVRRFLNTTDVFLLPSMNPDGFTKAKEGDCWGGDANSGRLNGNDKDLNRSFPDQFNEEDAKLKTRAQLKERREPETSAVIDWILANPFVLSASLHGGAVVASYPFDDSQNHTWFGYYSAAPDDDVFRWLSQEYADRHPTMKNAATCGLGFAEGITNGAKWYDLTGGMQDFNYVRTNSFEITLELSCCKYPKAEELAGYWEQNRKPLLNFLVNVHRGVKGLVTDRETRRPIADAHVVVKGIDKNVTTTERGEYWRLLVPGTYQLQAFAPGYEASTEIQIEITTDFTELLDFELAPQQDWVVRTADCHHETPAGE